jgi:hypothetical protein
MRIFTSILLLIPLLADILVAQDQSFPNSWSHDLDKPRIRRNRNDIDNEDLKTLEIGSRVIVSKPPSTFSTFQPINGSGPTPMEGRDIFKRKDVLGSLINRSSMIMIGRGTSKTETKIDETTLRIEATIAITEVLKGATAEKEKKVAWTEDIITDLPPLPDLKTPDQSSKPIQTQPAKMDGEYFTADGIWFIIKEPEAIALGQPVEWMPINRRESVSEIIKNSKP